MVIEMTAHVGVSKCRARGYRVQIFFSPDSLDPAERDAALTMCMIGGGSDGSPGTAH